jgi:hypothetical protein
MKLPNAACAIIGLEKLRDYSLNSNHSRGQHKARVFYARLGMTANDAEELQEAILVAIAAYDAVLGEQDEHGQRYTPDFPLERQGKQAIVRTAWIVRQSEGLPRLTSCYVLKKRSFT